MEVYLQSCSFLVDDIRRKPYSEMKRSKIELPHGNASGQFGESQTVRKSEAFSSWLGRSELILRCSNMNTLGLW